MTTRIHVVFSVVLSLVVVVAVVWGADARGLRVAAPKSTHSHAPGRPRTWLVSNPIYLRG